MRNRGCFRAPVGSVWEYDRIGPPLVFVLLGRRPASRFSSEDRLYFDLLRGVVDYMSESSFLDRDSVQVAG